MKSFDPITLEIYRARYTSVAEEMGTALRRTSFSPNIKERRDYSCAVFDAEGRVIAQGDHMPVHLGSMPMAVAAALSEVEIGPGDVVALNDPFAGGTHLPDVTLVAGVFAEVAGSRRQPAEGRKQSSPASRRLPPAAYLFFVANPAHLISYSARMMRHAILSIPDGSYQAEDALDDDGISAGEIPIRVRVTIKGDRARVDFTGTAPQVSGAVNAVEAITASAVSYVFRWLVGGDIPASAGLMEPIEVIAPKGTVVNATHPASVAGGNVETSQRVVDVVFKALAQAIPDRIPAASQG